MQTVNVTELQTNLIAWLERVRAGEEVLVSDLRGCY
jgi:antitoxin (DNA-binding transcriptional repressor) of toxin-antitoxin stability system